VRRAFTDLLIRLPGCCVTTLLGLFALKWVEYAVARHQQCDAHSEIFYWKAVRLCGSALQKTLWQATDVGSAATIVVFIAWIAVGWLNYQRLRRKDG
jgi:small-conductance mechanosensitive channel